MRPLNKIAWPLFDGLPKSYKPHTKAKIDLEENLDYYCCYCEVYSSDLEVEHVISQNQDNTLANSWDNFLLACGRCNGRDNKTNKPVNLSLIHFPHINNTFISFIYEEGGLVKINPALTGDSHIHASNMLDLVGIDKYPGNPKYPNLNPNDTRWNHRRIAWEWATRLLENYINGKLSAIEVVEFATQRGFFSVWFSVFHNSPEVRKQLIESFNGTCNNCFDPLNNYNPINRNLENLIDPT